MAVKGLITTELPATTKKSGKNSFSFRFTLDINHFTAVMSFDTTNKSAKFETLNCFCRIFHTVM